MFILRLLCHFSHECVFMKECFVYLLITGIIMKSVAVMCVCFMVLGTAVAEKVKDPKSARQQMLRAGETVGNKE